MKHPKRSITRAIRTRRPKHPRREATELESLGWPESLQVEERMTPSPLAVHWTAKVVEAVRLMREARIRHLPVVDDAKRLVGIVTDRDLRQVILDPRLADRLGTRLADALESLTLRDIMTWGVVTVRPETEIRDAARLMHQRKIGALPVVKNGRRHERTSRQCGRSGARPDSECWSERTRSHVRPDMASRPRCSSKTASASAA